MTGTRWADEIERSFGDGPTMPPTSTYVASGRAAVRRRRIATGAASTVAAALVIGGIGWSVMPGDARPDASQVATDPSPTASDAATEKPTPSPRARRTLGPVTDSPDDVRVARPDEREEMIGSASVTVIGDGTLIRRRGWTVDRVEVLDASDRSRAWGVAAHADDGSDAEWILLQWDLRSSSSTSNPAGQRFATFDEWLAVVAVEQQVSDGSAGVRDLPRLAEVVGDEVVTDDGVVLLDVVMGPAEVAAFGPVDEQAAVRLRLADGRVVFGRVDAWGTTTVDPAVLEEPTMAAFLRYLAAQGGGGEGLR